MRIKTFVLWVSAFVLLSGCSPKNLPEPPNIHCGKDVCDECRMIIADKKLAAGFVDKEGNEYKFDDIGCMRLFIEKNKEIPLVFWVHDFGSEEWIDADKAFFTHSPKLMTPMGYGIAAFSNEDSAKQFLRTNGGEVVSWEKMLEMIRKTTQFIRGGE